MERDSDDNLSIISIYIRRLAADSPDPTPPPWPLRLIRRFMTLPGEI
jgi:hypothetical protein